MWLRGISAFGCVFAALLLMFATWLPVLAQPGLPGEQGKDSREAVCWILERVARANALPVAFFARLIWKESRFQPNFVGPKTRHGGRALGIAQFMPHTAAERRLLEPFNPAEALPKSGAFLAELRDEFGNLGLAAAAYNAGAERVRKFLAGRAGMPAEARNYVRAITGRPVEAWALATKRDPGARKVYELDADRDALSCRDVIAQADPSFIQAPAELPERTVTVAEQMEASSTPAAAELRERSVPVVEQVNRSLSPAAAGTATVEPEPAWGVQLLGSDSQASALESFRELQIAYKNLLEMRQPFVIQSKVGMSGFWYRVRVATESRSEAEKLCSELRAAGGSCLVQRN